MTTLPAFEVTVAIVPNGLFFTVNDRTDGYLEVGSMHRLKTLKRVIERTIAEYDRRKGSV